MSPVRSVLNWRQRRHMSQLALACDAEISTRHLSFIETGRAAGHRGRVAHRDKGLERGSNWG
jgi:transcriptional regulator with XRE-family HTH domain